MIEPQLMNVLHHILALVAGFLITHLALNW